MKVLPVRLAPQADLRASLEALLREHGVSAAFVLPSCSSECMRAREAAVSPVSLMLKKALAAIRKTIAATRSPISRDIGVPKREIWAAGL